MIRYTLKCSNGHEVESWFPSAEGFERLRASGHLACEICGDAEVEKSLMAPKVRTSRKAAVAPEPVDAPQQMMAAPDPEVAKAIAKLKDHVEKNSDYVGNDFARAARAMHEGDEPHRAIRWPAWQSRP